MASAGNLSLQMPGFNLPLNHAPRKNVHRRFMGGFPNALDPEDIESGWLNRLLTLREITMLQIMNAITEKSGWECKVFDASITNKWREEIAQSGQDVTPKMMDWIIKELQWKAGIFAQTGFVQAFDGGVIKSDTAISEELRHELREAVLPFESVPYEEKDYHPGSEGKVVDLVHPSLFPVIYGRTRVLSDRTMGLDDCLDSMGEGQVLPVPDEAEASSERRQSPYRTRLHPAALSIRFQWLPCDVKISEDGKCRILSYIDNAHPIRHRALYEVVEKILEQTIPIWEHSLIWKRWGDKRISFTKVEYEDDGSTEPEYPEDENDEYYDEYEERLSAWYKSRKIIKPEPGEFKVVGEEDKPNFVEDFAEGKIQVIVKLANIELTPEKPDYEGGSWHIEGQLNERIAASAIYYYDTENITPSSLAFRHRGMDNDMYGISYEQDRHEFMQQIYGYHDGLDIRNDDMVTQELGGVVSKEGRLISFPNTLQHRVSPFSLADRSKPGHRKILALFLVDPHVRITSSANVPPQREDWWPETQERLKGDMVGLMTMEEAKAYRVELMEERGLTSEESNAAFQMGNFGLCEH